MAILPKVDVVFVGFGMVGGNGVGGAMVHWNGQLWRFLPHFFEYRTHLEQRYGRAFLPDNSTIQDWGITYDELEPYYDQFDKTFGTAGKAGNLRGEIQPAANPFEGRAPTSTLNRPTRLLMCRRSSNRHARGWASEHSRNRRVTARARTATLTARCWRRATIAASASALAATWRPRPTPSTLSFPMLSLQGDWRSASTPTSFASTMKADVLLASPITMLPARSRSSRRT